ncbi:unnamed protein product [Sympodiomycopsis kandeliae]
MSFSWKGLLGVGSSSSSAPASNHHGNPFGGTIGPDGQHIPADGLGSDALVEEIPLFGLQNLGNTCYANSVLQALYFCQPFRDVILSYTVEAAIQNSLSTPTTARPSTARPSTARPSTARPSTARSPGEASVPPFAGDSIQHAAASPPSNNDGAKELARHVVSRDPETLFVTLHELFASIAKSSAEYRPTSPITPTKSTSPRGISMSGKSSKSSKTKAPTRPSTATAMASPNAAGNVVSLNLPQSGVKRKDLGVSAGCADHEALSSFLAALRRENVLFKSREHQDAHEFLNCILNGIAENLEAIERQRIEQQKSDQSQSATDMSNILNRPRVTSSAIQKLFEGTLTNETRCLTCEAVTSRDESFLDLSIDLEHNTSVTACLRQFSASETLRARDKFFCDTCSGLQEAEKRMKVRKLPAVLALHLKRFKYEEAVNDYVKVAYKVVFPFELRLFNTTDDADDPDRLYELFGIVVHIGIRPTQGHYVSIVKVGSKWAIFDDDAVHYIDHLEISKYFGDSPATGSAYVLFYQAVDLDREKLGIPVPTAEETKARILPLASVELAARSPTEQPSASGTGGQLHSNHLTVPTVASASEGGSPLSSVSSISSTKSPSSISQSSPSKPGGEALANASNSGSNGGSSFGSGSLWSRRRGNSNTLAQAAEQARAMVDAQASSSSPLSKTLNSKSKSNGASTSESNTGNSTSWRNPFGKNKDRPKRSGSVSESLANPPPPPETSADAGPSRAAFTTGNHSKDSVVADSSFSRGGTTMSTAGSRSREQSPHKIRSGAAERNAVDTDPVASRRPSEPGSVVEGSMGSSAMSPSERDDADIGHGLQTQPLSKESEPLQSSEGNFDSSYVSAGVPSPILEDAAPMSGTATPERPERNPARQPSLVPAQSHANTPEPAVMTDSPSKGPSPTLNAASATDTVQINEGNSQSTESEHKSARDHHLPLRTSTLPAQGAAFAPLDRPLTKKEQHKVAKHAAQRRGSLGVTAVHAGQNNVEKGRVGASPTLPSDPQFGLERRVPSTFAQQEGSGETTSKHQRRRSTFSRAFGLGKKDKDKDKK